MNREAEDKMRAVAEHWRRFLNDDERPKTDHEKSFAMGCIDGLVLALRILETPAFDVSTFRSEFMPGAPT